MTRKTAALVAGFAVFALAVHGDVARGATPSPESLAIKRRLSAMRMMAESVTRRLDRHAADAAEAGGTIPLSADEEARLTHDVATAQDMLVALGPQASIRDQNSVAVAAHRLRLMKGEEPEAFGPAFAPMAGTGVITGNAINANTAAAISGVSVYIYDCSGRNVTAAVTNASGVYTTTASLETGTYYAYATKAGFADEVFSNVVYPPNGDVTNGTPINVTSGATSSNINFSLTSGGGGISGVVINVGTAASVATTVYIFDGAGNIVDSMASSAATGAYATTKGLKTGTYYAYAFGASGLLGEYYNDVQCPYYYLCNPTASTPIPVTSGSVTPGINLALSAGGRIGGTVTASAGGTPVTGYVYLYDSSSTLIASAYMDASGVYLTDDGLPNGSYFVQVGDTDNRAYLKELYNNIPCEPTCAPDAGTPVAATAGTTTTGINFALETGGGISGTVTDSASSLGISGAVVNIYTSDGSSIRAAATNASGVYTALGLPTGSYYVRATSPGNHVTLQYPGNPCVPCAPNSGTPVVVTAPATTPSINFTMHAGGHITGRVTDATSGAGIGGLLCVLYSSANTQTEASAYTTCTGDYAIDGLPTASFKEQVFAAAYAHNLRYRSEAYDNVDCASNCSLTAATLIPVTQGSTTANVNAALIRYRTVADFDASRTTDIGVYGTASGLWYIRNQFSQGYGGPGATIVPGDYDGDRYTDLAVYYEASGLWYVRRSTTGTDLVQGFGGPGYKPVPGDYDGDGKTDFAVFHDASGIWFIKQSSNGATVSFGFGSAGATTVPADYDRDGKTDAAVYYEASGLWYIRQSSSLTTFSTGYGTSGYKPVRGDFDGDGRSDIAVFHPASGLWFIRSWGTGATTSIAFGAAGYTPVPGDYDGDARTDLGVYDPASGLWFYRSVSGGATTTVGFGGAGYIPVVIK